MHIIGNTDQEKFLWYLTTKGMIDKYGTEPEQLVIDRIMMEMDVITGNKFTDYILNIWDIHDFCRDPDRVIPFCEMVGIEPPPGGVVPIGPGRGSVGGSMVCYCIGIHECDPILFGLYFERFLNPERIAYPDIDFDISQKYRHIVLAYIAWKYGHDKVAQIITYQTESARTVVNDVLQCANVSQQQIQAVKDTMPEDPNLDIEQCIQNEKWMKAMNSIIFPDTRVIVTRDNVTKMDMSKVSKDYLTIIRDITSGNINQAEVVIQSSWSTSKAVDMMERLEGLNKYESTHAAGVVIAPVELMSNVPLMKKDGSGVLACQYDMKSVEELGFLKMDALGLRTVDVNHDAEMMVRKWYDKSFSIRNTRFDDENAIKLIRSGDTVGIFQVESSGFTQMMIDLNIGGHEPNRAQRKFVSRIEQLRGLEVQDFMWISAGLAMYRPGPLDAIIEGKTMVKHLIDRKAGKEAVIYLFPEEKDYLAETYGVMIYQEQVMMRVRQMTGCTMGRADILRKAMGKKDPVLMKQQMDWFRDAAMKHDFTSMVLTDNQRTQIVQRACEEIDKFARYGFNKAHTTEYGIICYRNAYFKANYPVAFYTALLNSLTDNPKRQTVIIRDMIKHGINLLPPLVDKSDIDFTMTDKDTIRFGLAAIKGLGEKGLQAILEEKKIRGPFTSVENFRIRVPATLVNVTAMTNLAKCGAFDSVLDRCLVKMGNRATLVESMKDICEAVKKVKEKKKNRPSPSIDEILERMERGLISYTVTRAEEDLIQYAEWEKSILNYYISAHPIDAYVDEVRRWNAIEDTEPEDLPKEFYIAGFIDSVHETVIKKEGRNKGKKMGFVTVGTAFRQYEATLFPGIYESCVPYMKVGNPVVLKGKKDFYQDRVSIQGVYIRNMTNSGIRDCPECHIYLNDYNIFDLMQLKTMFNEHPGITVTYIHVIDDRELISLQVTQTIALNDRIIEFCDRIGQLRYKPI